MAVIDEIREQRKKAFKTMDTKGKLGYIWYYYKVHILVSLAVIIFVVAFIQQYLSNKPYGFYACFVDASVTDYSITDIWADEFAQYGPVDTDEYLVFMDTSVQLSENSDPQYTMSSREKLLLQLQTGEVHVITADTEVFENYAQNQFFYPLEEILNEEQLARYQDLFYYTDAATFDTGDGNTSYLELEQDDPSEDDIDHRDPSHMKDPIAVGIIVTDFAKVQESGFYQYLSDGDVTYQQHPSEAVLGIPVTLKDPALAVRFIEFLDEN